MPCTAHLWYKLTAYLISYSKLVDSLTSGPIYIRGCWIVTCNPFSTPFKPLGSKLLMTGVANLVWTYKSNNDVKNKAKSNYKLPTTNYQLLITNYQLRINKLIAFTNYQTLLVIILFHFGPMKN